MSEEQTKDLNGKKSFEERVFARFDGMDARFHSVDARLKKLEAIYSDDIRRQRELLAQILDCSH